MAPKKKQSAMSKAAAIAAEVLKDDPRETLLKAQKNEIILFERSARIRLHPLSGPERDEAQKEIDSELQGIKERHAKELADLGPELETTETAAAATADDNNEDAGQKKTSRAAKRRQKKENDEVSRRMAAEASMADFVDPKLVEESQLKLKLEPLKLHVHEVKADGHCLFRSLSHQLHLLGKEMDFLALRKLAADYIRKHPEQFEPFIELHEDCEDPAKHGGVLQAYLHALENTACWGGYMEIQAIGQALNLQVNVIGVDIDQNFGESKSNDILRISYHKAAYGLGEHYNSLVPDDAN